MQRTVAVVTMMVAGAGVVLPGCSSTRPHPARLGDDDILAMVRSQRHIDVIWMGTDHWTVTATGMDGGGHGPYDVHHRTNEPDYYAFDHLLLDSTHSRLASHFGLLFPLLESDDAEVVLTALYCYGQVTCGTVTPLDVPVSNEHLAELGAALRRLMNEHRDVRVRCMAANLLFRRELFELADLDRMLSDEDLAVRLIGTRTTYAVLKYIAGRLPFPPQAIGIPHRVGIRRQIAMGGTGAVKEALASILLEHLNDNHCAVRWNSYSAFRTLVERQRPTGRGTYTVETPRDLARTHRLDTAKLVGATGSATGIAGVVAGQQVPRAR